MELILLLTDTAIHVMDGGQKVGETLITSTGSYLANAGTVVIDKATGAAEAKLISAADYAAGINQYNEDVEKLVADDVSRLQQHTLKYLPKQR